MRVTKGEKATPPSSSNDELAELASAMQTMRNELDGKQYLQDSIAHLTHELKSPITAIQASLELLSPNMPEHEHARFLERIKAQSTRVHHVIENMLGLASLEHQQQLQYSTEVHLNALIDSQIQHTQDKANKLNISFKFPETLPMFMKG